MGSSRSQKAEPKPLAPKRFPADTYATRKEGIDKTSPGASVSTGKNVTLLALSLQALYTDSSRVQCKEAKDRQRSGSRVEHGRWIRVVSRLETRAKELACKASQRVITNSGGVAKAQHEMESDTAGFVPASDPASWASLHASHRGQTALRVLRAKPERWRAIHG